MKRNEKTRTSTLALKQYMADHGLNQQEVAEDLGTLGSTVSGWLRRDDMPAFVTLALESARRRRGAPGPGATQVLVVVGHPKKLAILKNMATELSVRASYWDLEDLA